MKLAKLLFGLLLGKRLPVTEGRLMVAGVREPVLVRRDRYGIPCIEATSDEDAWYGVGFCQGQDRAFQIESLLRVSRGTLAEIAGVPALPLDRLSRRVGFLRAAQRQLEVFDGEDRRLLEAYARGVTAGATAGCRRRPHEFALLRTRPTPYCATDVLAVLKLMSFSLASNWDCELSRLKILTEDGPEALTALDPTYPEWLPATVPPGGRAGCAMDRLAKDLAAFMAVAGVGGGSNGWAVAPSRTASGRAILANDPHLAPMLPPHWYLAHVRTPLWAVAGATFVGTPFFAVGHNGFAAWGVTAGLVDNTDLFLEELGPDGRSVRQGDRFAPCEALRETIQVRGRKPVQEDVLVTPRGPVISPALEDEPRAISIRATWLEPRPISGLFRFHRVRSFEDVRHAFEDWPLMSLNIMYADADGKIGWQLVGDAPARRKGCGTVPMPGWDPEAGWEKEPVPFDQIPHVANPEAGFVASANNQPTPDGEGPFLGVDWLDGYRVARIGEALTPRRDWDAAGMRALQMDERSLPWAALRDAVLATPAKTGEARQVLELLRTWDGVMGPESAAATVFELFLVEMARRIVEAKAPKAARWCLGQGFTLMVPRSGFSVRRVGHLARLMRERPEGWFRRSWGEEQAEALDSVIRGLRKRYGRDPAGWRWGRVRRLTFRHPVGARRPLGRVFNLGPFPWGGDANTVSQAAVDPLDPTGNPMFVASLRMVVEVGRWDGATFSLPGGQSGNPASPHYGDLLPFWMRGDGVPIAWEREAVEEAARRVLRLEPKKD